MKVTQMTLAAIAAVFASSVTLAEPPKFQAADANGDGGVDAAEFAATKIEKDFKKLDEDGDGKLSKGEYATALEEDCE